MSSKKIVLLAVMALAVAAFFALDLGRFLSFEYLKASQAQLAQQVQAAPGMASAAYLAIYIAVTALSLPGAAILTLAGGAVFGFWWGLVLTSFASTLGATLAFLAARFVLRDSVQARFGARLAEIDRGVARDGPFYLFTLRLIPLVPFFVINLVMGLTAMRTWTFYWVSQVGMLPSTFLFVNAGAQLARVGSVADLLSPGLVLSLVLLGLFPLAARRLAGSVLAWQRRTG